MTLSSNDSGIVLSELMGIHGFSERIAGLAAAHLVQQGGELAYLLTRFRYHPETGEIQSIALVPAGYGKVAIVDELRARQGRGS